jgi:hypothetical protein
VRAPAIAHLFDEILIDVIDEPGRRGKEGWSALVSTPRAAGPK